MAENPNQSPDDQNPKEKMKELLRQQLKSLSNKEKIEALKKEVDLNQNLVAELKKGLKNIKATITKTMTEIEKVMKDIKKNKDLDKDTKKKVESQIKEEIQRRNSMTPEQWKTEIETQISYFEAIVEACQELIKEFK